MKKRIISVMLALILVMSGIPAQVFAQDPIEGVRATEDYSGEKSGLTAVTMTGAGAKAVTNYAVSGSYESILDQLAEDDYEAYMHGRAKYQFMGTAAKLFPSEAENWLAPAEFYVPATGETSTHEIRFFGNKDLDPDKLWFTTYATDTETPYSVEIISPFTEFVYGDGDGTLYIYTATISIPDREPTLDGDIALQVWYDGNNLIKSIPIHHVSNLDSLIQPYITTFFITEYTESEELICDTVTIEFSGFNLPSTLDSYDIAFLDTEGDDPVFNRTIAEPLALSGPDGTGKRTITFRFADHDDPVQLQWVYFLIDGKMAWNFDGETDVRLDDYDNYVTTDDDENGVSVEISSPFNCLWATFGEDPEVMPEVSMPAMTRVPNLTV
ncbi:MAG: hypothetical protein IKI65_04625, partial [Firmicutes bacterium]|nr:hypothetical protein [Bacillota bacterium]